MGAAASLQRLPAEITASATANPPPLFRPFPAEMVEAWPCKDSPLHPPLPPKSPCLLALVVDDDFN